MNGRNNSLLNILLIIACIAVMGIGVFLSRTLSDPQENQNEAYDYISAEDAEEDGTVVAKTGDMVRTVFFDFTVNSAGVTDDYNGLAADDGEKFLVVSIRIINPGNVPVPMADSDFYAVYGGGDDDWKVPVTYYDENTYREGMLESLYTVGSHKEAAGDLVFAVPEDTERFFLLYEEVFEGGETGNLFVVQLQD